MCGIAGILKLQTTPCSSAVLDRMRDAVSYRGPDDQGSVYFRKDGQASETMEANDCNWVLGLAHRRLSIWHITHRRCGLGTSVSGDSERNHLACAHRITSIREGTIRACEPRTRQCGRRVIKQLW